METILKKECGAFNEFLNTYKFRNCFVVFNGGYFKRVEVERGGNGTVSKVGGWAP